MNQTVIRWLSICRTAALATLLIWALAPFIDAVRQTSVTVIATILS